MSPTERDERIRTFHEQAMALLDAADATGNASGTGPQRQAIADLLQELASTPDILPTVALERLHDAGSTATILHQGRMDAER